MIISVSRRTDIPAFYSDWLLQRLHEGVVCVRNPMNFHQVSRIALSPKTVTCLVFWTKNAGPLLQKLPEIDALGYRYYFLYTITPYGAELEPGVPASQERIKTFRQLSAIIGPDKVIWHYDPILFTDHWTAGRHQHAFATMATQLSCVTATCIVSFITMYRKCRRAMQEIRLLTPAMNEQIDLLLSLQKIGKEFGINLQSCASDASFQEAGIPAGSCIDAKLVAKIVGRQLISKKDKNQRKECLCVESIDIGGYNSCPHSCLYCYANSDGKAVAANIAAHDPRSPLLYGTLQEGDVVHERIIQPSQPQPARLF